MSRPDATGIDTDPALLRAYIDACCDASDNADDNGANPFTVTRLHADGGAHGAPLDDGHANAFTLGNADRLTSPGYCHDEPDRPDADEHGH
jgi:hypothetical protein